MDDEEKGMKRRPSQDSSEDLNSFNSANEALEWSVSGISLASCINRNNLYNDLNSEISSQNSSRPLSPNRPKGKLM